jgi:hypothetical protein
MKRNHRDDDLLDNSPTDELPVLSELDVVDDFERTSVFVALDEYDATGEHRPLRAGAGEDTPDDGDALYRDPTGRFAATGTAAAGASSNAQDARRLEILEARVVELTALAAQTSAQLADKDATIASLEERLTATRDAVSRRDETQRQLRASLAESHARWTDVEARLSSREAAVAERESAAAEREAAAAERDTAAADREAQLMDCETALEELEAELAGRALGLTALESELNARDLALTGRESALRATVERELQEIRDARSALMQRVDAQLAAYAALEARSRASDATRPPAVPDHAAAVAVPDGASAGDALRRSREHAATLENYIEGRRAHWDDMRARLAEQKTRIEELRVELEQRAARERQAQEIAAAETRRVADLKSEVAALRRLADSRRPVAAAEASASQAAGTPAGPEQRPAAAARPSLPAIPAVPAVPAVPGVPAAASPQQSTDDVAALRHALADRDARLEALAEQSHGLQQRLDRARESLRRLERTLVERDRALEASNARLGKLSADASHGSAGDTSASRLSATASQAGPADRTAPAMICLTGEAPHSYPLRNPTVTIGRSGDCDIQIATHFVSREHARLTIRPDVVLIEDLGSKNGVFVNAVRVDRETLRHGDLVTVGETQFRFMAE